MVEVRNDRAIVAGILLCLGLASTVGCIGARSGNGVPAPVAPAGQAAAPPEKGPAGPAVLDAREERQLSKDLVRDVEEYYRLLKEKNVEDASSYVDPQYRTTYQDDLWTFIATYAIESAHVASHQFFPQVDGVMAKVKVARTLFEKGSVVPKKSEIWMTWIRRDGRWIIRPQEQK